MGSLPEISKLPCDSIEIPQQMLVEENLIEAIYRDNFNDMEVEQLAKRVILTSTNKKILEMNRWGDNPRIELAPSDVNLPFILKRRQFPLIPAYAMTINKSQGQTFDHVGIYFDEPVFSHGPLYVALSRSRNRNHVKTYTKTSEVQGKLLNNETYFTRNVVYQEVF
ncbi:hypothetical protein AVEN_79521-1 [Araneus ventricosus]|uniref:UvrD-like helicase C-terminal domain-containing protein n=1 Tax=Araneus ventricosus TaxID=182803 RepID=A0A4Y2MUC3_ARAVE|nr:hypothetical protein AVEN_79521-1 [Araneus ventricosus]